MLAAEEAKLLEELMAYKDEVFRICLGFSSNASDAEDLAQDVYFTAFRNVGNLHSPYAAKEWLLRVTRNICLDHQKKRRIFRLFREQAQVPESGPAPNGPSNRTETNEQLRALKRAVNQLPKKLREAFVLREYGELSYQDVARTLGIKEGTVMSRLSRARAAVANSVKEDIDGQKTE